MTLLALLAFSQISDSADVRSHV